MEEGRDERRSPRVLVADDLLFEQHRLSELIDDVGAVTVHAAETEDFGHLDLSILALRSVGRSGGIPPRPPGSERWRHPPVLGITSFDRPWISLPSTDRQVVALVDRQANAEQLRSCLRRLLYAGPERRASTRASCCLPVEVAVRGGRSVEFATSLSEGGMGLATRRELEIGDSVRLRWDSDGSADEAIEARGEVVHARASARNDADYEIGVVFAELSDRASHLVRSQVVGLLAALGCLENV